MPDACLIVSTICACACACACQSHGVIDLHEPLCCYWDGNAIFPSVDYQTFYLCHLFFLTMLWKWKIVTYKCIFTQPQCRKSAVQELFFHCTFGGLTSLSLTEGCEYVIPSSRDTFVSLFSSPPCSRVFLYLQHISRVARWPDFHPTVCAHPTILLDLAQTVLPLGPSTVDSLWNSVSVHCTISNWFVIFLRFYVLFDHHGLQHPGLDGIFGHPVLGLVLVNTVSWFPGIQFCYLENSEERGTCGVLSPYPSDRRCVDAETCQLNTRSYTTLERMKQQPMFQWKKRWNADLLRQQWTGCTCSSSTFVAAALFQCHK